MNILMLGWELPPHNSGGLGVACYHMAKALASRGADIDFVLPHKNTEIYEGFTVHSASNTPATVVENGSGAYGTICDICEVPACDHVTTDIRELQRHYSAHVEKLVKQKVPDVIHAHDWLTFEAAILAKKLTSRPMIAHVHATEFDRSGEHHGNPVVHDIEYEGLVMADQIIAVSQATKDLIVREYQIPADKISIVHNSLNPTDYEHDPSEANVYVYLEQMKKRGYTIVVSLGRLTAQKGLPYFLRSAARVVSKNPKVLFLLAGSGELRDELLEQSAELGIAENVLFSGFVRGEAWRDAFRIADIFVMSSVSEPFGLTALEAAQFGPVVCITKQSGVGEVLKNVLKFDYWDTDKLADQILTVMSQPTFGESLKINSRQEMNGMSWDKAADKIMHLYNYTPQLKAQEMAV
jgi:glycosyltransferase involved in cell wall biosynthesis